MVKAREDAKSVYFLGLRYVCNIASVLYSSRLIYSTIADRLSVYDSLVSYSFILFIVSQLYNSTLTRFYARKGYEHELSSLFWKIFRFQIFIGFLIYVILAIKHNDISLLFFEIFLQQMMLALYSYEVTKLSVTGGFKRLSVVGVLESVVRLLSIILLHKYNLLTLHSLIGANVLATLVSYTLLNVRSKKMMKSTLDVYTVSNYFRLNTPAIISNYLRQHPLVIFINGQLDVGQGGDRLVAGQFYTVTLGLLNGAFQQIRSSFINNKASKRNLEDLAHSFAALLRLYLIASILFHVAWLLGLGNLIEWWWRPSDSMLVSLIFWYSNLAFLEFFQGVLMMFHLAGRNVLKLQMVVLTYEVVSILILVLTYILFSSPQILLIVKLLLTGLSFILYIKLLEEDDLQILNYGCSRNIMLLVAGVLVFIFDVIVAI
ncbi:MAG: hypothetical protein DWQ21_09285 [Bacteroidetes bacterium]|nr:MAG: hypothetical protein DWQ21_09285 [Bacteroidota bacterium]